MPIPSSATLDLNAFAVEQLRPDERVLWTGRPDPGQSAWYGYSGVDSAWSALGGLMLLAPLDLLMLLGTRQLFPSLEWVSQNALLWLLTLLVLVNSRLGVWRARRTHYVVTDERVFFVVGMSVRLWVERARLERVTVHDYEAGAGTLRLWHQRYDSETGEFGAHTTILIGIADVKYVATLLQPSVPSRDDVGAQPTAAESGLDWLIELDHPSFRVRKAAAQRFATLVLNRQMPFALLRAAMRDENVLARIRLVDVSACDALEVAAAQEICEGLRATEPTEHARAAAALQVLRRALEQMGQMGNASERGDAAEIAVRILSRCDDSVVPMLTELLSHPSTGLRQRVLSALTALRSAALPAAAALDALLDDAEHELSEGAAVLLVELGSPTERVLSRLIAGLARPRIDTRPQLLAALQSAGVAALPALTQALGAANGDVVAGVASVLGRSGVQAALPGLIRVLQHRAAQARQAAAEAIGSVGQGSYEAASALTRALSDPQEAVSRSAAAALRRVACPEFAALVPAALSALARPAPWAASTLAGFGEPAVSALLAGLQHVDKRVRLGATAALGELGEQPVTADLVGSALITALGRGGDEGVAAAKALQQMGGAAQPALQAALGSAEPRLRRSVARIVWRPGAQGQQSAMLAALDDPDPMLQLSAAIGLCASAAHQATVRAAIERLMHDPDAEVRCAALSVLTELPESLESTSAQSLFDALRDPSPRVREAAAQALCWLRAAGAIAPLTAALADPDLHVAAAAARALGACAAHSAQSDGTAAVVTGLIALFRRSDAACRNEALLALVSFGELAVPGLIQALADVDGPVRLGATDALAALGPRAEAAVPALLQQLGTEHVRERASAARALGAVGLHADVVVHQLAALLNDPAAYVRDAVLYALFLYGPRAVAAVPKLLVELERDSGPDGDRIASCLALIGPAALPALIRALALPNDRTRIRAAKALSLFGSQADPALAALIIALDNPAVRPYAAEALRSLSDAAKAQIPLRWAREVTQLRVERSG